MTEAGAHAPSADPIGAARCPQCGGAFHCGMNNASDATDAVDAIDAAPCPCMSIRLTAATLAALREQPAACLCPACLRALATAPATQ